MFVFCAVFFNSLGFVTSHDLVIQGVTAEHLLHRAEAPNDVGDDALKAADCVYWKKL